MVTYYVKLNESYTITAADECKVYNASGVLIATCPANSSINVKAATNKLKLSDDNAVIKKDVQETLEQDLLNHVNDSSVHLTQQTLLNHVNDPVAHLSEYEWELLDYAAITNQPNTFEEYCDFTNHLGKVTEEPENWTTISVLNITENDARYAPKTYGTSNGILITDGSGNVTVSTVISVSELNTLNNNLTNIATKISSIESRLTALES